MKLAGAAARAVATAAALASLSCSAPAPQTAAERRQEQTALAQQRAASALARDDQQRARVQLQAALDYGRAVENEQATAVGLLNLAAVLHRAGDLAGARTRLLELLEHQPPLAAEYQGRAEARMALIALQSRSLDEAARRAQRAEGLCANECAWRLALGNIQAGIALRGGDLAGAEARALATKDAAVAAKALREEANAWRLLGEIAGEGGRGADARAALLAALDLDRKAEVPERIALDLLALSRLELALGERKAARDYARRAADVAEAARLAALLAAAQSLLQETR